MAHPVTPLARTKATITIDLPPLLAPAQHWLLEGNDSALVVAARPAVRRRGWSVEYGPAQPNSDHWSWIARGVPSVFVVADSGWQGVTLAQEDSLIARWWHPHEPSDEWREDFPIAGLARQAEFLVTLAITFAGMP